MKILLNRKQILLLKEVYDEQRINSYLDRYDKLTPKEKEELSILSKGGSLESDEIEDPNDIEDYNEGNYDDSENYDDEDDTMEFNKRQYFINYFSENPYYLKLNGVNWIVEPEKQDGNLHIYDEQNKYYSAYILPFKNESLTLDFLFLKNNEEVVFNIKRQIDNEDDMLSFINFFEKTIIPAIIKKIILI